MKLTSWRRIRHFLSKGDDVITDEAMEKRHYLPLIASVSASIENFLDRLIKLEARTEYKDTIQGRLEYFVRAWPITTLTSIKSDSTGLYSGSETTETLTYIGKNADSVTLDVPVTPALKGLQINYTGGMASHGTQSQFVLSNEGATKIAVGNFVVGTDSEAMGYVISKVGYLRGRRNH
jgi:hypothetical protein